MTLTIVTDASLVANAAWLNLLAGVPGCQEVPALTGRAAEIIVGSTVADFTVVILPLEGFDAALALMVDLVLAPQDFILQARVVDETEIFLASGSNLLSPFSQVFFALLDAWPAFPFFEEIILIKCLIPEAQLTQVDPSGLFYKQPTITFSLHEPS